MSQEQVDSDVDSPHYSVLSGLESENIIQDKKRMKLSKKKKRHEAIETPVAGSSKDYYMHQETSTPIARDTPVAGSSKDYYKRQESSSQLTTETPVADETPLNIEPEPQTLDDKVSNIQHDVSRLQKDVNKIHKDNKKIEHSLSAIVVSLDVLSNRVAQIDASITAFFDRFEDSRTRELSVSAESNTLQYTFPLKNIEELQKLEKDIQEGREDEIVRRFMMFKPSRKNHAHTGLAKIFTDEFLKNINYSGTHRATISIEKSPILPVLKRAWGPDQDEHDFICGIREQLRYAHNRLGAKQRRQNIKQNVPVVDEQQTEQPDDS